MFASSGASEWSHWNLRISAFLEIQKMLFFVKGAGTVPRLIHEYYPKQRMQGWELDPDIIDLGRKHMGLNFLEETGVLVY